MGIGELCVREVIIVKPDETVQAAANLMSDFNVGDVVVVEDGCPVGILTDRDIAIRVVSENLDPQTTPVRKVMSKKVVTMGEHVGIGDAMRRMRSAGIRRLPVVGEEDNLVGIVTLDDLIDLLAEEMETMVKLMRWQQNHTRQKPNQNFGCQKT